MFANGAISWMSRKIKVICDSSMEAELAAGAVAAGEPRPAIEQPSYPPLATLLPYLVTSY